VKAAPSTTGASTQKHQNVDRSQSSSPQPNNAAHPSNGQKHQQKHASRSAPSQATQSKPSQPPPAAAHHDQHSQRTAAAHQNTAPQPSNASQGKGKGKGDPKGNAQEKNENQGKGDRTADGKVNNGQSQLNDITGSDTFLQLPPRQRELIRQALAGDLPRLASMRAGLRERMTNSPLCDGQRFAANLASLLMDIWKQRKAPAGRSR
jgi:hypothetical protein